MGRKNGSVPDVACLIRCDLCMFGPLSECGGCVACRRKTSVRGVQREGGAEMLYWFVWLELAEDEPAISVVPVHRRHDAFRGEDPGFGSGWFHVGCQKVITDDADRGGEPFPAVGQSKGTCGEGKCHMKSLFVDSDCHGQDKGISDVSTGASSLGYAARDRFGDKVAMAWEDTSTGEKGLEGIRMR